MVEVIISIGSKQDGSCSHASLFSGWLVFGRTPVDLAPLIKTVFWSSIELTGDQAEGIHQERGPMSVINTTDKQKVVSVAENGVPVTGEMIAEWCAAYDRGELPESYEVDGVVGANRPRPPLHGEKMRQCPSGSRAHGDEEGIG